MMSSLKLRLAASLLAGQILIYLASYVALPVFGVLDLFGVRSFFPMTYTEAAWQSVRDLVLGSLRRAHHPTLGCAARAVDEKPATRLCRARSQDASRRARVVAKLRR